MTNGMLWNIHKIARYGDTFMILDHHKLKFSGNLLIEKVNVSFLKWLNIVFRVQNMMHDNRVIQKLSISIKHQTNGIPNKMSKKITATNTLTHKYSPNFHKSKFIFIVIAMNILNFGDCVKNMWNPNK